MDTKHLHAAAAVRPAFAASVTGTAVQVRLDAAFVADSDIRDTGAHAKNLDPEFMAENTRIVEKGLAAMKCVVIGSAESDTMDKDQCLTLTRSNWLGSVVMGEFSRFVEDDGVH
jgi:hypothetical protein